MWVGVHATSINQNCCCCQVASMYQTDIIKHDNDDDDGDGDMKFWNDQDMAIIWV